MIAAPIPSNDTERLRALHDLGLLDTAPEERFDRITRLLTLLLDMPIAYISLVDRDRQWFKSARGLEVLQTPRSISFCGHAILSDEPLIVPDATKDERFHDNPQVIGEPFLRFYAGVPLTGPGGHKVGTLCVADVRPRSLGANQVEALREMGRLVERELGLVEVVQLQRDLIAGQRRLVRELSEAAAYVRSILPPPLDGVVSARWRFEPSSQLGGDCLGYEWIDPDHFVAYLLDVSGHGVGAALLSVSVANVLRSRSLPGTDFRDPAAVLAHLNETFPMDRNDERYLTAWYGVFDGPSRKLTYASAGHPPPLLVNGPGSSGPRTVELGSTNFPVGMFPGADFTNGRVDLGGSGRLFVFSDGAYELRKPGGALMTRQELIDYLGSSPGPDGPDDVWRFVGGIAERDSLDDDFSVLEIRF